jgi:hypothetical protein
MSRLVESKSITKKNHLTLTTSLMNLQMIFLKDVIDFEKVAQDISSQLPNIEIEKIERGFQKFFWADENSDFWFYSVEECQEVITEMQQQFVEEESNDTYFTLAGATARDCGLELIGEPSELNYSSWIL